MHAHNSHTTIPSSTQVNLLKDGVGGIWGPDPAKTYKHLILY